MRLTCVAKSPITAVSIPIIDDAIDPFKGIGKLQGRRNILMTEWGPYNFEYPLIWNTNPIDSSDTLHFKIYGPKGKWKVVSKTGLESIYLDEKLGLITAIKQKNSTEGIELKINYTGKSFIDGFGIHHIANKPYVFFYKRNK